MESICSSETLVETRRTTRRHIPENDTFHNHLRENLKSYIIYSKFTLLDNRREDKMFWTQW
jgi:hypothetical protein